MNKLFEILRTNRLGYLATVDKGRPCVRPFGIHILSSGQLGFVTANTKNVYRQLVEEPWIEIAILTHDMITVRIQGEIEFFEDVEEIETIMKESPQMQQKYRSADNPILVLFTLKQGIAVARDISGKELLRYNI